MYVPMVSMDRNGARPRALEVLVKSSNVAVPTLDRYILANMIYRGLKRIPRDVMARFALFLKPYVCLVYPPYPTFRVNIPFNGSSKGRIEAANTWSPGSSKAR